MSNFKPQLSQSPSPLPTEPTGIPRGFLTLRAKFSLFVSLVIVLACSSLSGYLIQQEAEVMKGALLKTGTILVKTLNNVSVNRLIIQDTHYLETMLDGALSAPEVVYAIARDQDGNVLVGKSKGKLVNTTKLTRDETHPLFPDDSLTEGLITSAPKNSIIEPLLTVLHTSPLKEGLLLVRSAERKGAEGFRVGSETIYDLALPVYRQDRRLSTMELLLSENLQDRLTVSPKPSGIIGIIQIGLSTAHMQQSLNQTVWHIGLLTVGIILVGILLTILLANRIVTPLQRLAVASRKIAEGDLSVTVATDTQDEVGQLTTSIDRMARALQQREEAISHYVHTITKQVTQLSTLHQTGIVITSTLDVQKLFSTVLKLLRKNLGFQRMILVLQNPGGTKARVSDVSGVPLELEKQIRHLEFPISPGSIDETLLLHGRPVLAYDLEEIAHQMSPLILPICRQMEVISFVCAPLLSHQRVLGYLGADRGHQRCTQEDLDLLLTIASHVAVAIDNAQNYEEVEKLAQTLEERVKERTQDLQSANERLQELDRLKSSFVSIVSHELRTPMTSIKGLVENMLDGLVGDLNDRQSFYLERMKYNIERLTRMINDLLDLSRIEAGRMDLHRSPVNMGSLAREVVETLQSIAQERSLILEAHISDPIGFIQGDRDKLIQIFTNLINNALKFTESPGTVKVEVNQRDDDMIQTCVIDSGCGIPLEEQKTIFERFYRGQSSEMKNRGAGLGLAITKSLVELHGGSIWVESSPGEGSRFCVILPVTLSTTPS
ncbi:GAF domain-containing sensor histidine kinase [Nitrospira sp. T9]|uniref:sensor histidine kinase n=1 Tax=unclassified Nitrospira TaxID=2652172 RepID=UPI003F9D1658